MIEEILKSLSDTELFAIANELDNPNISNESIYNQLMSKRNDDVEYTLDSMFIENLLIKLSVELSKRLITSYECR
jgi:hypothetical protein